MFDFQLKMELVKNPRRLGIYDSQAGCLSSVLSVKTSERMFASAPKTHVQLSGPQLTTLSALYVLFYPLLPSRADAQLVWCSWTMLPIPGVKKMDVFGTKLCPMFQPGLHAAILTRLGAGV